MIPNVMVLHLKMHLPGVRTISYCPGGQLLPPSKNVSYDRNTKHKNQDNQTRIQIPIPDMLVPGCGCAQRFESCCPRRKR